MRIARTSILPLAAATVGAALVLFVARPVVPAPPGAVGGRVTVIADGAPKSDASKVVVYLEGIAADVQPLSTTPQVHQHDQQFSPDLTVVTRGSTIAFPNDDKIFHNVFSVSEPARFDLGLYKSGESKSVQFERPGVVDVYCNIHPQMAAKIKVLDTPYYALTAANGSFFIPNVPPGTYPVVAWQPYGAEYRGTVTVASGGTATVSIQLTEGEKTRRHLRKDGQPYGRYK
jgi:plastocyanin